MHGISVSTICRLLTVLELSSPNGSLISLAILKLSFQPEVAIIADMVDVHLQCLTVFPYSCGGNEQLLAYSTLLETNKPYLTNVTRISGLPAALLS